METEGSTHDVANGSVSIGGGVPPWVSRALARPPVPCTGPLAPAPRRFRI